MQWRERDRKREFFMGLGRRVEARTKNLLEKAWLVGERLE